MVRLFMGREVERTMGLRWIYIKFPYGLNTYLPFVRYFQFFIRNVFKMMMRLKEDLKMRLQRIVDQWFKGDAGGVWVAPDGRTYFGGEPGYWLPDWSHVPFGVCPICTDYGERWRSGFNAKELWAIMMDSQHQVIHADSAIHRPICYCQIMPWRKAQNYGAIQAPGEAENEKGWTEELWNLIFDEVALWGKNLAEVVNEVTRSEYDRWTFSQEVRQIQREVGA